VSTRQQLNLNGLQTSLKYDNKSQELKSEMMTIQLEKANLEKSLDQENKKNETVMSVLEQTESKKNNKIQLKELFLKLFIYLFLPRIIFQRERIASQRNSGFEKAKKRSRRGFFE